MIDVELTPCSRAAHKAPMERLKAGLAGAMLVLGSGLAAGCITVEAPDRPIVIELNINITQEVVYRLTEDVRENIEENPDIF